MNFKLVIPKHSFNFETGEFDGESQAIATFKFTGEEDKITRTGGKGDEALECKTAWHIYLTSMIKLEEIKSQYVHFYIPIEPWKDTPQVKTWLQLYREDKTPVFLGGIPPRPFEETNTIHPKPMFNDKTRLGEVYLVGDKIVSCHYDITYMETIKDYYEFIERTLNSPNFLTMAFHSKMFSALKTKHSEYIEEMLKSAANQLNDASVIIKSSLDGDDRLRKKHPRLFSAIELISSTKLGIAAVILEMNKN